MPFLIDTHTGILIKKAARLFEQVANKDLDKLGVTYAQTIFLVRLWHKDGQNQMELARSAGLKQPTVVRQLDRMERDKLIKRVRNKNDRRVYNFFLTEKARAVCEELENHANTMQKIAATNLEEKEVQKLNKMILNVVNNLQKFLE